LSSLKKRKYVLSGKFAKDARAKALEEQKEQPQPHPLGKLRRPTARRKDEGEAAASGDDDMDAEVVSTIKMEEAGDESLRRTSRVRKPRITM